MFRYPADRLPVAIILFISLIDFVLYFAVEQVWILIIYWFVIEKARKGAAKLSEESGTLHTCTQRAFLLPLLRSATKRTRYHTDAITPPLVSPADHGS